MINKTSIFIITALLAGSAMAASIQPGAHLLKDGTTVHVFADGKMGMENRYGVTVPMKEGEIMQTQDGHKFEMKGNELARTSDLLRQGVD